MERLGVKITPIRRMAFGMFLTAFSFVISAWLQERLDAGEHVHWNWQILAYIVMTVAEVLVSATGLEFAYAQAPRRMKATVMAFWYLTVSFGNIFVAIVIDATKDRPLSDQFWLFAAVMAVIALLFTARVAFYKGKDYAQGG
jgi:POT family proton-dependent oligopeptide transporter